MSRLTSSTVESWSGVSTNGKASSSSRCHGESGPKACPLVACRAAYSLISSAGDLPDRLARPALALRPVGAAEPVQGRLLAADVAGHLVELVGGDVEPVRRVAALGGAVLQDEVLAGGALHVALVHLDVAADAVLLVHDVVAGLELERVDLPLAARRHPAHVLGGGALAGEVVAGEHREALALVDEAVGEGGGGDVHEAAARGSVSSDSTRRTGTSCSSSTSAMRWAGPWPSLTRTTRQPSPSQPRMSLDRALDVAAVGVDGAQRHGARLDRAGLDEVRHRRVHGDDLAELVAQRLAGLQRGGVGVEAERGDAPPRLVLREADRGAPRRASWYDAAPRSIGAWPPPAAAAQEACRNSSLVATRSCARLRARSGSSTRTWVSSGIRSMSISMSSTSTGASDSMPSTAWPSASFSASSAARGAPPPAPGRARGPRR